MISIIFGFGGRIGRLHYFVLTLALAFVMTFLTLAIVVGMMPHYAFPGGGRPTDVPERIMAAVLLTVGPIFLWFTLTLQAKRFRDIGLSPLYVIPCWIAANLVDRIVAFAVPSLSVGYQDGTAIGALLNLMVVGALLFWPGKSRDDWSPPAFGSTFSPSSPHIPTHAASSSSPRRQPGVTSTAAGFGKRGL